MKNILFFFTLITKIINHINFGNPCKITNLIDYPVFISNEPIYKIDQILGIEKTGKFTISGFFRFKSLKQDTEINLINILNKFDKKKKNPYYPDCNIKNYLENPSQNEIIIKNNPNCEFLKNLKKIDQIYKLLKIYLFRKENVFGLKFEFPYSFKNEKTVINIEEKLTDLKLVENEWIIFAIGFDYEKGEGKIFYKNFEEEKEYVKNFELFLPDLKLKSEFLFSYSENFLNEKEVYGVLNNVNVFPFFFENIDMLQFFYFNLETENMENNYLEILGTFSQDDKYLESKGFFQKEFFANGNIKEKDFGLDIGKGGFLDIGKLKNYEITDFTKSITLFISLRIDYIKNTYQLFEIKSKDTIFQIHLKKKPPIKIEEKLKTTYQFNFTIQKKNEQKKSFLSNLYLPQKTPTTFAITLIQTFKTFKFLLFTKTTSEKSQTFQNISLTPSNLEISLFDKTSTTSKLNFSRFKILKSPYPFFAPICNKNCEIAQTPSFFSKRCLTCKNSVLDKSTGRCLEFCEVNTKNVSGICLECKKKNCEEIEPTRLAISRFSNSCFVLTFTRKIPLINFSSLENLFEVKIDGRVLVKDFGYSLKAVDTNHVLLDIKSEFSFFNKTLEVETLELKNRFFYDEKRNYIYSLNSKHKIDVMYHLGAYEEIFIQVFVFLIFGILFVSCGGGCVLFFLGFKHDINDLVTKKFIKLFQKIQFLPVLLFLQVYLPSNCHKMISDIFHFFLKINNFFNFTDQKENYVFKNRGDHPNFFDKQLSVNFLENFGNIFIIHFTILFFYGILRFGGYLKKFLKTNTREKIFFLKEKFEYNFIIISFLLFYSQLILFATLNIQNFSAKDVFSYFSFTISFSYIIIILAFLIIFTFLYIYTNGFLNRSELKYKMSIFFIGYKNNRFSNLFDFITIILKIFIIEIVVIYKEKVFYQILAILTVFFTIFCMTILVRPYENKKEMGLEIFCQILFYFSILIISSFALKKSRYEDFEFFGWIVIVLIVLDIFIYFLIWFVQFIKFLKKLEKSSKLIFYENENIYMFPNLNNKKNSKYIEESVQDFDIQNNDIVFGKFGNLKSFEGNMSMGSLSNNSDSLNIRSTVNTNKSTNFENNEIFNRF